MSMSVKVVSLGVDAGSTTMKLAGVDASGTLVWRCLEQAEPLAEEQARRLLASAREETGCGDVPVVATGYGRKLVEGASKHVTEITCHARGVYGRFGRGGTLVDIGGQDSKVISIDASGNVLDFAMNDKCAAGTGRFLENTASRLRIPMDRLDELALSVSAERALSSTCTVFAESEIISLLARAEPLAAVMRGLHRALVRRVCAMVRSVGVRPPVYLSGGVAINRAVRLMLAEELGVPEVLVPEDPQLMGAYGAALCGLPGAGRGIG